MDTSNCNSDITTESSKTENEISDTDEPFVCINEREKWRQKNVSEAFEELRQLVPAPPNKKLSKHEILKMAIRYIKVLVRILEWQKQEKALESLIWKETSSSYQRKVYSRSSKTNVIYYMDKEFKSTLIVRIPERRSSQKIAFRKVAKQIKTKTIVSVVQETDPDIFKRKRAKNDIRLKIM